jgi:hypothetical protein
VLPLDSDNIPSVPGTQSGLNSVSMAVGVMEKALYSSFYPDTEDEQNTDDYQDTLSKVRTPRLTSKSRSLC